MAVIMIAASGSYAQVPPYHREIRDLKATVLDLKGLPSDLNSAVFDLSAKADGLTAQHGGLSVRQDATTVRVSMTGDVLFDFDKADIQSAAEPTLMDIARLIASVPASTIIIEGHTDSKGSAQYNKELSLQRAKAVVQWLVKHGADKARLSVKALGDSRPIEPNTQKNGADNPQGRALNRRVEFVFPKQ
ncbi:OmpA family protein [Ensifer sp. 4252]|uniref:OmpA family protein n=1 Tax=Ensifer sp. 4252 TaxID=3373915 RepID=UPI003D1B230D